MTEPQDVGDSVGLLEYIRRPLSAMRDESTRSQKPTTLDLTRAIAIAKRAGAKHDYSSPRNVLRARAADQRGSS
jgi:hypothetical protein